MTHWAVLLHSMTACTNNCCQVFTKCWHWHLALVLCDGSFYPDVLPVLSSLSSGHICPLTWSWEYSLEGSLDNRPFIFLAFASLVYLFSLEPHLWTYYCGSYSGILFRTCLLWSPSVPLLADIIPAVTFGYQGFYFSVDVLALSC